MFLGLIASPAYARGGARVVGQSYEFLSINPKEEVSMKAVVFRKLPKGLNEVTFGKVAFVANDSPLLNDPNAVAVLDIDFINYPLLVDADLNRIKKSIGKKDSKKLLKACGELKEKYRKRGLEFAAVDDLMQELSKL